ncbi:DNA-3-methyladenine glycosylase family protein [Edaphobacter modestus]|uniref:DNA-3-methyladenine glycosylase family protein n=1 Tax=Edaphobacter modestus TaxID=388466 RepID=UPI001F5FA6A8|nr:DNA-3-methyladenine glycosylase 2 family protein [Edaphobacter modestus]
MVSDIGECTHKPRPDREPYEALIRAVAYQQLHAKAGDAILGKLLALFGSNRFPGAAQLLAADVSELRACGFSARKVETLRAIAEGSLTGLVPLRDDAEHMTDDELIARLTSLKGIGRWTVEMLLIYTLERMDVLPADDFGVREGYRRLKSIPVAPTKKEMEKFGHRWSPYRTLAAWYLWRLK